MHLHTWLDAVEGRTNKLAAYFGVTKSAVSQWRRNGVPVDKMKALCDYTHGDVTLDELVPDMKEPTKAVA